MLFVRSCYLPLFFIVTTAAFAQGSTASDTLSAPAEAKLYTMPEFVVSATRWKANVSTLPSSVTVLTADDLSSGRDGTLAAALEGVPGLFLKSYGGPGSVVTTSIRGMGAEHTLVLVDGQRYNNVRDGQVDFGIMQLQNIERIEVLRGGFSSMYGTDALGGIINIVTQRPGAVSSIRGEILTGSYGMRGGQLSAELPLGQVGLMLSARREAGKGDYEFKFQDGLSSSIERRQNADYVLNQIQLFADAKPFTGATMRWSTTYNWSDRGSPGAVLSEASSNLARLRDAGLQSQASLEWNVTPRVAFRFSSLFNAQDRLYRDPLLPGETADQESDFGDRSIVVTPNVRFALNNWTFLNVGGEYAHSLITSNQVEAADRSQYSFFVSSDHTIELSREFLYQVNVFPSFRFDRLSGLAGDLSPKLGINVGIWRPLSLRVKSSVGRSFRAPNFNDLYWKGSGNPLLKPERSVGFDAGAALVVSLIGKLELEASYFDINTSDRIVWTPDANGLWSPKNLQRVQSAGVEFIAAWRLLNESVLIRASYTNADSRKTGSATTDDQTLNKQLPYLPHETAALSLTVRLSPLTIDLRHEYTGFRYTTETNDARYLLQPYQKTDVSLSALLSGKPAVVTARVGVSNVFNSVYQIFPYFPMPLRMFNLRVSVDY
jgi:vitamin B12 transporter